MEAEETLGPSVTVGARTFTPVVRLRCTCTHLGGLVLARGDKRVVAVLVQEGERHWRLDVPTGAGTQAR